MDKMSGIKKKRNSYEAQFKIKVAEYAMEHNNCRAASHFGVSEKQVRDWRKDIQKLKEMSKTKRAIRGNSSQCPELEKKLLEWIQDQRSSGLRVSRLAIRMQARKLCSEGVASTPTFSASEGWCNRFMTRHNLSLRQKRKISQELPDQYEDQILEFQKYPSVHDVIAMDDCIVQTGDTAMNQLHIEDDSNTLEEQSHSENTASVFSQKEPTAMDDNHVPASRLTEIFVKEEDHDDNEIKEESLEDEAYSNASFEPLTTCKSVQDVKAIEDEKECKVQTGDTAMNQLHIEDDSITLEEQSHCESIAFVFSRKEPTAMDDNHVPACRITEIFIKEEDHDDKEIKEESLEEEAYSDASFEPLSTFNKNLFEVCRKEGSVTDERQTNAGLYEENIDLSQNCLEIKEENYEDNGDEQTEEGFFKEEDSDSSQDCLEIKEESLEYDPTSDSQSARLESLDESLDENSANNKMRKKLCRVCNKRISFYYLKAHMRVHTKERPYVCEICNMTFTVRSSLVRHMQKHTEGIIFPCDICKKVFPKREILKQHKEVHKNEKRYSCDVCKKFFTTKTTLRHHLEIHLEKKTITWETLLNHMRIYQTEKPYICDICNEEFSLKSGLTRHKRIHKTDGTFTCGICNKSLSQKRTLAVHMKTHTKTF